MTFRKGQSGNPAGQQRGTRVRLTEAFIRDLEDGWRRYGEGVIGRAAAEDPVGFMAIVARLLPREHVHEAGESLAATLRRLAETRAPAIAAEPIGPVMIEGHAELVPEPAIESDQLQLDDSDSA